VYTSSTVFSSTGVQEYYRGPGLVQEFSNSTGLHRSRISTEYSGNGVVQGYRFTGIV
jgi:hypothetical protein